MASRREEVQRGGGGRDRFLHFCQLLAQIGEPHAVDLELYRFTVVLVADRDEAADNLVLHLGKEDRPWIDEEIAGADEAPVLEVLGHGFLLGLRHLLEELLSRGAAIEPDIYEARVIPYEGIFGRGGELGRKDSVCIDVGGDTSALPLWWSLPVQKKRKPVSFDAGSYIRSVQDALRCYGQRALPHTFGPMLIPFLNWVPLPLLNVSTLCTYPVCTPISSP